MSKNLVLTFFLILLLFLWAFSFKVNAQDDYFNRDFEWEYGGSTWTWSLSIPKDLYEAYKNVPVFDRVRDGPGGYGFLTTTNDYYLELVAEEFQETVDLEGYGSFDEVSFVLAFVQSLDYTSDSVTSGYDEYPRFPIETLVDNGGDCEDTSILFATITIILGYGTVYLSPPEHYAVGVLGDELSGYYWTYNDQTYYYCETTGDDWKIGDLPEEYEEVEAYIYPIREWEQYVPIYNYVPTPTPTPTPSPTATPSPTPIATPSPTPTPSTSSVPTPSPTAIPTPTLIPPSGPDQIDLLLYFGITLVMLIGGVTITLILWKR